MDTARTAWTLFLAGVAPAVLLAIAGLFVVARRALTLKGRVESYRELPVVRRIVAANAAIASHGAAIAGAPLLIARFERAIVALRAARERLSDSAATVRTMWGAR